jgi:hypothetical protein
MKTKYLFLFLILMGCGSMSQESDIALIREPGHRTYSEPPEKIALSAQTLWEYAVLSDNVYLGTSMVRLAKEEEGKACSLNRTDRLTLQGWDRWADVPSTELKREAEAADLQLEVWESRARQQSSLSYSGAPKHSEYATGSLTFDGFSVSSRDFAINMCWSPKKSAPPC